jgi:hypothetical protein
MMFRKTMGIGLVALALGVTAVSALRAEQTDNNNRTIVTFSQPVEIPGQVLPAGTYTFQLANSMTDRHIVQVFNADGSQILATFMAIPDYRLVPTGDTLIKFTEVPRGSPEAIRAWFYPGNTIGQEFVYPKGRAAELAMAAKVPVPATTVDSVDATAMTTTPIIAVTPEQQDAEVTTAIQTSPTPAPAAVVSETRTPVAAIAPAQADAPVMVARRTEPATLPATAGGLPTLVIVGFASIVAALGLMVFGRRTARAVR